MANVTFEYDGQPIDMHVSLHVNCCDFSKNTNFHTRTPSNIATYLCTPICESNTIAFRIFQIKHNPQYLRTQGLNGTVTMIFPHPLMQIPNWIVI